MLISYHLMYFFLKMTILNRFPICKQKIGMCKQANAIQKKSSNAKEEFFTLMQIMVLFWGQFKFPRGIDYN